MLKRFVKINEKSFTVCSIDDNGLEQGPFTTYNGIGSGIMHGIEIGTYKDGKLDGSYEKYDDKGQLREMWTYQNGEKNGVHACYDSDGSVSSGEIYKNGKKDGPFVRYWSDSRLHSKGSYKNGELHGPYEEYGPFDQSREKCVYVNGVRHGPYEEYDHGGNLRKKGFMAYEFPDGPWEEYDEDHNLHKKVYCKGEELTGEEAEAYLKDWREPQDEEIGNKAFLKNIQDQLAAASDLSQRQIARADTPERQVEAEKLIIARRQRDVFNRITRQVLSAGDKQLEAEMAKTIDKDKLSKMYREAYGRLSEKDKELCTEIGRVTGQKMKEVKNELAIHQAAIRARKKNGQR